MGGIEDYTLDAQKNYTIPLLVLISIFVALRILITPPTIETVFTDEEEQTIAEAAAISAELNLKKEDYLAYADALGNTFDTTTCDDNLTVFANQQDMLNYLLLEQARMIDIEGTGSCITLSGFPKSMLSTAESIVPDLEKTVVRINASNSLGTGFFLTDELVFTNFHVAADDNDKPLGSIKITTIDNKVYYGQFLDGKPSTDVAIIKLNKPATDIEPVKISETPLQYGSPVLAIGHPTGFGNWRTTLGIYYGEGTNIFNVDGPRFSLPNAGGASGSPIFNMDGELVAAVYGMNDIAAVKAQRETESYYTEPLHAPIMSPYAISAGVGLNSIKDILSKITAE